MRIYSLLWRIHELTCLGGVCCAHHAPIQQISNRVPVNPRPYLATVPRTPQSPRNGARPLRLWLIRIVPGLINCPQEPTTDLDGEGDSLVKRVGREDQRYINKRYLLKQKCVYESEWLTCQFCRSRGINSPCVKLPGPKTASSLPVQITDTADVNSQDGLLLEFAYSKKYPMGLHSALFKIMATQYGLSISSSSLRHAILAEAALQLPYQQFGDIYVDHANHARTSLRRKISDPHAIDDADLLASYLLMCGAAWTSSWSEAEIHAKGCRSLLTHFREKRYSSPFLVIFGPMIKDRASYFVQKASLTTWETDSVMNYSLTNFQQRLAYLNALKPFRAIAPKVSSTVTAIDHQLEIVITSFVSGMDNIARSEVQFHFERQSFIRELIEYSETKLQEQEFQCAIQAMQPNFQTSFKALSLESELARHFLLEMYSI